MLNVTQIRQDFPILKRLINGHPLAYLDNGASTQKPQPVIDAIVDYYQNHNANINRGVHTLAEESTQMYEDARATVAQFIHADTHELIFVRNTTEAINLIAYGWGLHHLKKGDEIITTVMEHHSNIVPWQMVANLTGAVIKFIDIDSSGELILEDPARSNQPHVGSLKSLLSANTKIVSLVHVSNTLSSINPVAQIIKQVKKYNPEIITIIDGAQSTPHMSVDVKALNTDFYAFSGHKMCGPMGIGGLYGKKAILEKMHPFMGGGDMIAEVYLDHTTYNQIPEKFEAGTPNVAGAVGLAAACRYLQAVGLDNIDHHEHQLANHLRNQIQTQFPGITILGPKDPIHRSGIVTFQHPTIHAHDLAQVFNHLGIAVRSGHHCTMPLHQQLNIPASTRVSPYLYNTEEEVERVLLGLQKANQMFGA